MVIAVLQPYLATVIENHFTTVTYSLIGFRFSRAIICSSESNVYVGCLAGHEKCIKISGDNSTSNSDW